MSAAHVQHSRSAHRRRKYVTDTVGDEPVAVADPRAIPVGELVVPCVIRHGLLLALLGWRGRPRARAASGTYRVPSGSPPKLPFRGAFARAERQIWRA